MPRLLLLAVLTCALLPVRAQETTLPPARVALAIRGVVTAQNDAVLPRVRVTATVPATNRLVAGVMTDSEGRFVLAVAEAIDLMVTFTKAGYAAQTVDLTRDALLVASPPQLVRTLVRGAAILGRVMDRGGEPAMLTRVVARRVAGGATAPSGPVEFQTDADDRGDYRIGGLPAGQYAVTPLPPAGGRGAAAPTVTAEPAIVTVVHGDEIANVNFTVDGVAPPTVASRPAPESDTGVMRGRITDPAGRPVRDALVSAVRAGTAGRSALTDADGGYEVSGLAPGDYRVDVSKNGYVRVQYGQTGAAVSGKAVAVDLDRVADRIDITLPRGSAISGTVVDEYGEPLHDVAVDVLQVRSVAGRARALRLGGRRTDDRGHYRVFGLLPGAYVVRVLVNEALSTSGGLGYPPIYYPGHASVEQAAQIQLSLGVDALDGDIVVRPIPAVSVTGVVVDSSGQPVSAGVMMIASERSGVLQVQPAPGRSAADGSFTFTNVPPGEYVLQSFGPSPMGSDGRPVSTPEFATQFVTVADVSPPPIRLRTSRGTTLAGRIAVDGAGTLPASGFSLLARTSDFDRAPMIGAGPLGFSVQEGGGFRYLGLTGPRRIVLGSAPPEWYLKSVVIKGEDVTDAAFDFGLAEGTIADAEIVVSAAGASIAGRVTDDRAVAVTDYTVIVFPTDPDNWYTGSRWLKMARPSQDGSFRAPGLPAGDYWTAALDRLDGTPGGGEWQDAELLRTVSNRATRVTLAEGQSQVLSLRLLTR